MSARDTSEWALASVLIALLLVPAGCTASVAWAASWQNVEQARIAAGVAREQREHSSPRQVVQPIRDEQP